MIAKTLFVFALIGIVWANIEVEIDNGKLTGNVLTDRKGKEFYSFLSIPYAKPPINELRFEAPVEAESWEGVLNATKDVPVCPQLILGKAIGVEDCLYLNVHTPEINEEDLKPVIVFIHGGAFIEGSGSVRHFGAEYLTPEGVVLVTINYRLGMFGFISSEDPELNIPGNNGLKDQNMALKWVQKNINKFGGNPDNVMIVGESAGGASVHLHMLSPLSQGLFHKVISMSGTAANQWSKGIPGTFEIKAKQLNIFDEDKAKMLKNFKEATVEDILGVQRKDGLIIPIYERFESSPIVEYEHEGAFMTSKPLDTIATNNYTKVPFMFGYTNVDGLVIEVIHRLYKGVPFIPNNFSQTIPSDIDVSGKDREELMDLIKHHYYGNEEPSDSNLNNTTRLATDIWFITGFIRLLNAMKDNFGDDVYLYRFSADTQLNYFKKMTPETEEVAGACHIDDLGHLFKTANSPKILAGSDEEKAVDNIVKMFTNFAKTGKPTDDNDSLKWLPVTNDVLNYMEINVDLTAGVDPDKASFDFWRKVFAKYDKKVAL